MKKYLKKNQKNFFDVTIIINEFQYNNQSIQIEYFITKNKNYYYKIYSPNEILITNNFFDIDYIEGIKGFKQHIISNKKFHLTYNEKSDKLELITWNNSIFINGNMI